MLEEENKSGITKWVIAIVVIVLLLIGGVVLLMTLGKDTEVAKSIGKVLPFGELSPETPRTGFEGTPGGDGGTGENNGNGVGGSNTLAEPMFRQLTNSQIAGATTLVRDGKTYVRYVLRENGHVYEIDTTTWVVVELTNTVVPRVYEAFFGNNGNTVVLRYIKLDQLTRQDVIKTFLADLVLPEAGAQGIGKLTGRELLDNISSVSVSPDGSLLFFLLPIAEGVSGSMMYLTTGEEPREVLRNTFSEWLPQVLNNRMIVLTTKASANVPGFAYLYNPTTKALTRIVREKNGLTTLANGDGTQVLYSENIGNNATLGLYSSKGFPSDEGAIIHESPVPLTTLPEKCAWGRIKTSLLYCGSFESTARSKIPDEWYQGVLKLKDIFYWTVNSTTLEIALLAESQKEVKKDFDVFMPFVGSDDTMFFFTDKNTGFLWMMRIVPKANTGVEETLVLPPPPEEASDAGGVLP